MRQTCGAYASYALLNIAVIISVSIVTSESAFSTMHLLKTDLRYRSSVNRLNGLVLEYFNSVPAVDVQDVINRYLRVKNDTRIFKIFKAESANLVLTGRQMSWLVSIHCAKCLC